jgi:hypothetical protein
MCVALFVAILGVDALVAIALTERCHGILALQRQLLIHYGLRYLRENFSHVQPVFGRCLKELQAMLLSEGLSPLSLYDLIRSVTLIRD